MYQVIDQYNNILYENSNFSIVVDYYVLNKSFWKNKGKFLTVKCA